MVDVNLKLDIPLITKMWETFDKRFIATLMNPIRIGREGAVRLKLDKAERLQALELERVEVEARRGSEIVVTKGEPYIDFQRLAEIEQHQEYIRKQINLGKSIFHAEDQITADDPVPDQEVDPDWLYRWKEQAEKFSADDMQLLWGKILAGEFKKPGTFNYRTLDILSSLSKDDAEVFLRLCSVAVPAGSIVFIFSNESINKKYGLNHFNMLKLRELGLLSYVESTYAIDENEFFYFQKHKKLIRYFPKKETGLDICLLTAVGQALYSLVDVELDLSCFREFLSWQLKEKKVESILVTEVMVLQDDEKLSWRNKDVEKFSTEGSSDS